VPTRSVSDELQRRIKSGDSRRRVNGEGDCSAVAAGNNALKDKGRIAKA